MIKREMKVYETIQELLESGEVGRFIVCVGTNKNFKTFRVVSRVDVTFVDGDVETIGEGRGRWR